MTEEPSKRGGKEWPDGPSNGAPYKETGQADKQLFKLLKKDQERFQQITWKITWNMYKYIIYIYICASQKRGVQLGKSFSLKSAPFLSSDERNRQISGKMA